MIAQHHTNFIHSIFCVVLFVIWSSHTAVAYKLFIFSEYCEKYAKPEDIGVKPEEKSSDEELSDDDYGSEDDQVAGKADP